MLSQLRLLRKRLPSGVGIERLLSPFSCFERAAQDRVAVTFSPNVKASFMGLIQHQSKLLLSPQTPRCWNFDEHHDQKASFIANIAPGLRCHGPNTQASNLPEIL